MDFKPKNGVSYVWASDLDASPERDEQVCFAESVNGAVRELADEVGRLEKEVNRYKNREELLARKYRMEMEALKNKIKEVAEKGSELSTLIVACRDSDYETLTEEQYDKYFHNPSGEADGEYLEETVLLDDLEKEISKLSKGLLGLSK